MSLSDSAPARHIGYVTKCYPRFSETFVNREIIAREAAGERVSIASLRAPKDPHFHHLVARVRGGVTWIPADGRTLERTWEALTDVRHLAGAAGRPAPGVDALAALHDEDPDVAAQGVLLARWALQEGVDHLHAHFASVSGRTTRLAALLTDLPWTVTAHAKDIFHQDNSPHRHAQVLGGADAVVAVSDMTAAWIGSIVPTARVRRIYNGMDLEELAWRSPLTREPHLVGVGRLVAKKGWTDLIEASRLLRARGLPLRVSIAGTGPLETELREQVARAGLTDVVTLLGPMPQHEVVGLVRSAAAFAAPCVVAPDGDRDGLPTVLLESMALGTPVVATPVAGIPEAVEHDATGLLVEEHDPVALAAAVERLLTEPEIRVRLARGARSRVEERFDVHGQARELRRLTDSVHDRPGGPGADAADAVNATDTLRAADEPVESVGAAAGSSREGSVGEGATRARTVRDVVYVVTDPGVPAFGRKGASIHVQEVLRVLATRAREAGGRVRLVATRLGGPVPKGLEDVETVELGRPRTDDPVAAEAALQRLDAEAAGIVGGLVRDDLARRARSSTPADGAGRAHGPATLVYQRYALWSARVLEEARDAGARTVLEVNAPLVQEQRQHRVLVDEAEATALTVRALRAAHTAYAVSTPVARWASGLAGRPVDVVSNGVDVQRFADPADGARAGSGRTPPAVAFVGTFRPWHAPELLVEAAARLAATGDPVRLLLVGDGPLREPVVAAARAAGVEVEATGSVDPARIPGLLARADIACAPYPAGEAYFSPLKVLEYLGAGLPTVAAAVADLPGLVRACRPMRPEEGPGAGSERAHRPGDEPEAILVTPGDVEELTQALRRLVRDPALRARLGAAARAAATARFTWEAVVDRVLASASGTDARHVTGSVDTGGIDVGIDVGIEGGVGGGIDGGTGGTGGGVDGGGPAVTSALTPTDRTEAVIA